MKKVFVLYVLLFLIIFIFPHDRVEYAFKENTQGYYKYEISFENKEISTWNFEEYFKDYKILTIYPAISEVYKKRFPFISYSFNTYLTFSKNINKLKEKYIAALEGLGYRKEALKIKTSGIFIEKIVVYSEETEIINLKHNFPKLQYRLLESI